MTTHISETTLSDTALPLLPHPTTETVAATAEATIQDIREDVSRADERVATLETAVHDNHVELTKRVETLEATVHDNHVELTMRVDLLDTRLDDLNRKFDTRFSELKEWGDAWTTSMKELMELVKVS